MKKEVKWGDGNIKNSGENRSKKRAGRRYETFLYV